MKEQKKTLLWRVEGDDLHADSYLFGTMHVRDRRAFRFQDQVYACIRQCEALATEFDLDELSGHNDPELVRLPDGLTLDQLMTPRQYEKLRQILRKVFSLDLDYLRHLRPLVISNLIDERILARDQPLALDEHLWHYARRQGKKCLGIETLAEQVGILRSIPLSYQADALRWTGRHIHRHRRQLLQMTDLYRQGDIFRLYRAAKRGAHGLRKTLLYRRNYLMADRISLIVREQPTVCAVGAAHLAGEKGLLRLLKQHGLLVRPVPATQQDG